MAVVQRIGFILVAAGILGLIFYFGWGFFGSPIIPLVYRILAGVAAVGFVVLLGYVSWDRYRAYREESDEIKEVKR